MSLVEFLEVVGIVGVLSVIAYWGANTYFKMRISRALIEHAVPFTKDEEKGPSMLVLGDSTGVGVGAEKPEHSVAGRIAMHVRAGWVENYAVSGAQVRDLPTQIQQAKRSSYDYLLIQVGANDIIAFHNPKEVSRELEDICALLPEAGKTILMSAGNVGGATIFPHPLRPFYEARTRAFHVAFAKVCAKWGVTYVNLYEPFWKDPFLRDRSRYFSLDGLHPSSYGYGLWFEKVKGVLG